MMPGLGLLLSQDIGVCGVKSERLCAGFWCSPPTDSPNPLEEAKLHRRTLGLIYGFTQRDPPPHLETLRGG